MRKQRLYAPFIKQGNRWIRATFTMKNEGVQETKEFGAYTKQTAIKVYQSWLLEPFMKGTKEIRELRPIKEASYTDDSK